MSDSVRNERLEDVLSSVRRLVSAEGGRRHDRSTSRSSGALVLTSAQRVEGGAREKVRSKSLEERIAELEVAVGARPDEWEPDGSEDQDQHKPDRIVFVRSETPEANALRKASEPRAEESDEASEAGGGTGDTQKPSLESARENLSSMAAEDTFHLTEAVTSTFLTFRHGRSRPLPPKDEAPEAPMEIDAAPVKSEADVRPFRNPDDMFEEVTARWTRAERGEPPHVPAWAEDPDATDTAEAEKTGEAEVPADADETLEDETAVQWGEEAVTDVDEDAPEAVEVATSEQLSEHDVSEDDVKEGSEDLVSEDDVTEVSENLAWKEPTSESDISEDHVSEDDAATDDPGVEEDVDVEEVAAASEEETVELEEPSEDHDEGDEETFESELSAAVAASLTDSVMETMEQQATAVEVETVDEADDAGETDEAVTVVTPLPSDIEALRPLVAELIREELRGELGRQITQGVRKLVRQEIRRMINARAVE